MTLFGIRILLDTIPIKTICNIGWGSAMHDRIKFAVHSPCLVSLLAEFKDRLTTLLQLVIPILERIGQDFAASAKDCFVIAHGGIVTSFQRLVKAHLVDHFLGLLRFLPRLNHGMIAGTNNRFPHTWPNKESIPLIAPMPSLIVLFLGESKPTLLKNVVAFLIQRESPIPLSS